MMRLVLPLTLLGLIGAVDTASASVTYTFTNSGSSAFTYTSADFVTQDRSVPADQLSSCSAALSTCTGVKFFSNITVPTGQVDQVELDFSIFGLFPGYDSQTFAVGSLSKVGTTTSSGGAVLDVALVGTTNPSPVPLPASAPLFGAALLALCAGGYGATRRKGATA